MEEVFKYCPWPDRDFLEINTRLFDFQENNYLFWDHAEKDVIERYLTRCKQLEDKIPSLLVGDILKKNFYENWKNLLTALRFVESLRTKFEPIPIHARADPTIMDNLGNLEKCDGSFESQPRYYDEVPIKQAIRENRVILQRGSAMGYIDEHIPALKKAIQDLGDYATMKDCNRVEIRVSEFLEKRKDASMVSLLLRDLKKTNKLVLLPD